MIKTLKKIMPSKKANSTIPKHLSVFSSSEANHTMDSYLSSSSVSQEEFNIFHRVDRLLFRRLVMDLRRDPAQSSQVMALWLWLEHALFYIRGSGYDLIAKSVLPLPETLLDAFATESEAVLSCVESDHFPFASSTIASSSGTARPRAPALPMFQMLIQSTASLEVFYSIRLRVIWGIADMTNRVCARAFADIIKEATERRMAENIAMSEAVDAFYGGGRWINNLMMVRPPLYTNRSLAMPPFPGVVQAVHPYQHYSYVHGTQPPIGDYVIPTRSATTLNTTYSDYHAAMVREVVDDDDDDDQQQQQQQAPISLNNQDVGVVPHDDHHSELDFDLMTETLNSLVLDDTKKDDPDERTIFLTFSKGYPISEKEVKLFFTSLVGAALIEEIHMQYRSGEEQSLFARLVLRSASDMDAVLQGNEKVKFSIDGKHVWARKYVRMITATTTTSTPTKSNQCSPKLDEA